MYETACIPTGGELRSIIYYMRPHHMLCRLYRALRDLFTNTQDKSKKKRSFGKYQGPTKALPLYSYKNYMYGSTCWRWTHATLEFMTVVCLPRGRGGGRVILAGCQWRVIMGKALDSLPTTLSSFHVILVIGIWKLTLRIICH